jgi:hypothetical protein
MAKRTQQPKDPKNKDKLKGKPKGGRQKAKSKEEKIAEAMEVATKYDNLVIYTDGTIGSFEVYDSEFHCSEVLRLMQEGCDEAELCIELGINPATLYMWSNTYKEFKTAILMGRILCRAWWISQGRRNIHNPFFNNDLYKFQMVNRFEWARTIDQEIMDEKIRDMGFFAGTGDDTPDYDNMSKELLNLLYEYADGDDTSEEQDT